jgi:hypothetical protein
MMERVVAEIFVTEARSKILSSVTGWVCRSHNCQKLYHRLFLHFLRLKQHNPEMLFVIWHPVTIESIVCAIHIFFIEGSVFSTAATSIP